ncbi:type II toxin-antitoxin system VapC family toxin [Mucilaginibacter flavus]|uniref:type II toxin-antitoxin system VapC family toxin n=1 Tax=Mucilaginibacter flavus TaxID=931504 RepID=UPI0025B595A3|nr:type II toxin-antitoxin system VapC family toxin [Mucilaginibacter flavus]MDN3579435.1 type II toxin-antitoxin system VapC family toxin [Mucilaginibacter flavus]
MNLLLDTNIIFYIIRSRDFAGILNYINPDKAKLYISVATEAELKSLAIRNRWGQNRVALLDEFLEQINIIDISQSHINTYAEIDTFSQRLNPGFTGYLFDTPRNMGKNDLWIATLCALLGLKLLTTDADFDHLNGVFFEVQKMKAIEFSPFF